jgi:hypothetical protein
MEAYIKHVWCSYQISDVERGGMLPERGTLESEQFHESLHASLHLEGELWECPACGRLLFRRPAEQKMQSFLPENRSQPDPDAAPERAGK